MITGVNGFIGKNLCNYLTKRNIKVYGVDNFYSSSRKSLRSIKNKNFFFAEKSILDHDLVSSAPFKLDAIIHLAAQTSVVKSVENPDENNLINIEGFKNVIDSCLKSEIRKFIFTSSCAVYGDSSKLPSPESTKDLLPKSPYAKSKLNNEIYSKKKKFDKMSVVGLRLFNVYGPMQNGNSTYSAVIAKWISFLKKKKKCSIYGLGDAERDFCYVEDLCELLLLIMDSKTRSGIFNFCTQKPISMNNLFKLINKIMKKKNNNFCEQKPIFKKSRKGEIKKSFGDNSLLKKTFNFVPKISIEDGIKKMVFLN
tara:strand:- start:131 stop:1060 length:930 start_codon:yes stop_codon:yes gene_type:complete